jgi:hypothetical protein
MDMIPIEPTGQPDRRDVGHDPEPDLTLRPEPPDVKPEDPPWYGRAWFGYLMGAVIAAGGSLKAFAPTRYIGVGILAMCKQYMDWAGIDEPERIGWIEKVIEAIRAALTALQKILKARSGK